MFTYSSFHPDTSIAEVTATFLQYIAEMTSKFPTDDAENDVKSKTESLWSKKEILGHLVDSARYNLMRFTEIPVSPITYVVKAYAQDHLVTLQDYQHQDGGEILALWKLLNLQIMTVWQNLSEVDLNRTIHTPEGDETTLDWLIKDYVGHIRHHLDQIVAPEVP